MHEPLSPDGIRTFSEYYDQETYGVDFALFVFIVLAGILVGIFSGIFIRSGYLDGRE